LVEGAPKDQVEGLVEEANDALRSLAFKLEELGIEVSPLVSCH
jgi:hypothetical protein